jgi:cytochrome c oxidase subunit 1
MTIAALFTAAAQIIFFYNFFGSMKSGEVASANPWNATSLEWVTSSPPPPDNFGLEQIVVHHGAYEYSVPGASVDFIPQNAPPSAR